MRQLREKVKGRSAMAQREQAEETEKSLENPADKNNKSKNNMRFFIYRQDRFSENTFPMHDYSARTKSIMSALVRKKMDLRLKEFKAQGMLSEDAGRRSYDFFMEPADIFSDFVVMAPQKKGVLGVEELNVFLRNTVDLWFTDFISKLSIFKADNCGSALRNAEIKTRSKRSLILRNVPLSGDSYLWDIRLGDRMMCVKNDYSNLVFNGECGTVVGINNGQGTFRIKYPGRETICSYCSGREARSLSLPSAEYIIPAYAMTIHKSQGSEYEDVCIVISPDNSLQVTRNLLYTGVSRARSALTVITDIRSWENALSNKDNEKDMYSGALAKLITNYVKEKAGESLFYSRL